MKCLSTLAVLGVCREALRFGSDSQSMNSADKTQYRMHLHAPLMFQS